MTAAVDSVSFALERDSDAVQGECDAQDAGVPSSLRALSDLVVNTKYARYLPHAQRRETWLEICARHERMFVERFPHLRDELRAVYAQFIEPKKVLPSMRGLQFAGPALRDNHARIFNCSFVAVDDVRVFSEVMFLLMSGCGVGYSVQTQHVAKLPPISVARRNHAPEVFVVQDTLEGWADAVARLCAYFFDNAPPPEFDFTRIRAKGAPLRKSGGRAPGAEPLRACLDAMRACWTQFVLAHAAAHDDFDLDSDCVPLSPLAVHDALCHESMAVLAGGIRRSALIALFSLDDADMRRCKHGAWWETAPQRGRANNSAVLLRGAVTREQFDALWRDIVASRSGEPGIFWTNDADVGTNPCGEISLHSCQMCNLVDVNASTVRNQADLEARCRAGALMATLQASFTDFHYLRPAWKRQTDAEALIGVGLTGVANRLMQSLDLEAAARAVVRENVRVAQLIGIRPSARCTTIKPAGTTSTVLGCSSGVHAWHAPFYWRRVQLAKTEPLYAYLAANFPLMVEDCSYQNPDKQAVAKVPIKAPDGAICRDSETALEFLERTKRFNQHWVRAGHVSGANANNVSATVSFRDDEADDVGRWLWTNRDTYHGLSVLPYDGGSYAQMPFEAIDEAEYEAARRYYDGFDISRVLETEDRTDLLAQSACAGGACERLSVGSEQN